MVVVVVEVVGMVVMVVVGMVVVVRLMGRCSGGLANGFQFVVGEQPGLHGRAGARRGGGGGRGRGGGGGGQRGGASTLLERRLGAAALRAVGASGRRGARAMGHVQVVTGVQGVVVHIIQAAVAAPHYGARSRRHRAARARLQVPGPGRRPRPRGRPPLAAARPCPRRRRCCPRGHDRRGVARPGGVGGDNVPTRSRPPLLRASTPPAG